ncbi:MAG: DNA-binding response regulator [Chloroflexi bacterium HGW-Chloroflexi-2]|jgi:two-component system alkaline phosphatase synthesis response regulator PhoP|nr:MAG: DNA-binding response regulator [Chloroflexi bacterium HGW-Chloroflexi-2]
MQSKILVVDDEPGIRSLIMAYLQKEGYDLREAADGPTAIKLTQTFKPDLIILDIMLPGMDGLEVLSLIRQHSDPYIIFLTAKTEETDKIVGLTLGGDDYVTKPFSPRELTARVKSALRREQRKPEKQSIITSEHIRLDMNSRQIWVEGNLLDFTQVEFDILHTFMLHHHQVLSREQLLEHVWGYEFYGETRTVDVHVGHIRKKLGDRFISTIRGVGYRFDD